MWMNFSRLDVVPLKVADLIWAAMIVGSVILSAFFFGIVVLAMGGIINV